VEFWQTLDCAGFALDFNPMETREIKEIGRMTTARDEGA
jgi:hypothetical protein